MHGSINLEKIFVFFMDLFTDFLLISYLISIFFNTQELKMDENFFALLIMAVSFEIYKTFTVCPLGNISIPSSFKNKQIPY